MTRRDHVGELGLVGVLALTLYACCATSTPREREEQLVIQELDDLVANPCPQDVRWRADRDLAREDARRFLAPSPAPVSSSR